MVSRYCQKVGDFRGAIEFLLIAKRHEEAFQLAKDHDEVEMFATALGPEATEAENQRIATFYESKSNWGLVRTAPWYTPPLLFSLCLSLFFSICPSPPPRRHGAAKETHLGSSLPQRGEFPSRTSGMLHAMGA